MKKLLLLVPILLLATPAMAQAAPKPRVDSVSVAATVVGDQVSLVITADLQDHGKPREVSAYAIEGGMWCFDASGIPISVETHGTNLNENSLPVPDSDPVVLTSGSFTIPPGADSCRAFVWFFPDIYAELASVAVG